MKLNRITGNWGQYYKKFEDYLKYQQIIRKLYKMDNLNSNSDCLILGYYALRGKIQVCRLLCQYLHVAYKDVLFTPQTWAEFKVTQKIKWKYPQLPFLMDKNLIVTQTYPICFYIINKTNQLGLLGKTIQDQAKIDMFICQKGDIISQILSFFASSKDQPIQAKMILIDNYWHQKLKPKLLKMQGQASYGFYTSYLTIADFYIYEIFYLLQGFNMSVYLSQFPKLIQIFANVSRIPEIMGYQLSFKAIRNICPCDFYQKCKIACQGPPEKTEQPSPFS